MPGPRRAYVALAALAMSLSRSSVQKCTPAMQKRTVVAARPIRSPYPAAVDVRRRPKAAATANAAEPKLTVSRSRLAAALKCTDGVDKATRTPIMLVTGTGVSGDEAYAIGKPAFDGSGVPSATSASLTT
jgi:hypothetical protein